MSQQRRRASPASARQAPVFWDFINDVALQQDELPRVLAAMQFPTYCGSVPRGTITWWRPDYLRPQRREEIDAWFPARAAEVRAQCIDSWLELRRAEMAPVNRALRDATVHMLATEDGSLILVDDYSGEWRSTDNAVRGRSLIELGAWRWQISYGKAGARIARLCGFDQLPLLTNEETTHGAR